MVTEPPRQRDALLRFEAAYQALLAKVNALRGEEDRLTNKFKHGTIGQ